MSIDVGTKVDILILNGVILQIDNPVGQISFNPGWVAIGGEYVVSVGVGVPSRSMIQHAPCIIDAKDRVIMPGFVNAHTHLAQSFMRGLGTELPLAGWLSSFVQPLEAAMTPEDVWLASLLGLSENLKNGVTTVVEHHKTTRSREHVEAALRAAIMSGVRMLFARGWRDSGPRQETSDHIENEMCYLLDNWHERASKLIKIAFGPMEPARCSSRTMKRLTSLARERGIVTHIHLAETISEVQTFHQTTGMTQTEWLYSLNALNDMMHLVHCVHVTDTDLRMIAECGSIIIHCPVSNARLAAGIAPLRQMLDHGIKVCLGTDGSGSNDSQCILETAKICALFAKVSGQNAPNLRSSELIKMLTVDGAAITGWLNSGHIRVGMKADLIVIDTGVTLLAPMNQLDNVLIYGASETRVNTVIVNGELLIDEAKLTRLDERDLLLKCRLARQDLFERAGLTAYL